ncbi:hypothetical protein J6590_018076 [Homalodisca vitripennis]|nr:hypothetical protein J6590_018076 [Homalodisca vitripennis]
MQIASLSWIMNTVLGDETRRSRRYYRCCGAADIINLVRLTSNTNHVHTHSSPVLHLQGVESFPSLYDFHLKPPLGSYKALLLAADVSDPEFRPFPVHCDVLSPGNTSLSPPQHPATLGNHLPGFEARCPRIVPRRLGARTPGFIRCRVTPALSPLVSDNPCTRNPLDRDFGFTVPGRREAGPASTIWDTGGVIHDYGRPKTPLGSSWISLTLVRGGPAINLVSGQEPAPNENDRAPC